MAKPPISGLYVITDKTLVPARSHLAIAEAALEGGTRLIQLRDKEASTRKLVEVGQALRTLTRRYNALFLVNDRVDVALAVEADGVHLGQEDMPLPLARRLIGEHLILGASVETVEEALAAQEQGADYLGVGPMFATDTKPDAGMPVGPARLREIKSRVQLPVIGIGGITAENLSLVKAAGADGIAVISAIATAPDMVEATRRLIQEWLKPLPTTG